LAWRPEARGPILGGHFQRTEQPELHAFRLVFGLGVGPTCSGTRMVPAPSPGAHC
jgi:hypothetical protein